MIFWNLYIHVYIVDTLGAAINFVFSREVSTPQRFKMYYIVLYNYRKDE